MRLKTGIWALRRFAAGVSTLLVVSLVVFTAMHAVPGGYVDMALGQSTSEARRQSITIEYGLDKSVPVQYVAWLRHVLVGNFGETLGTHASIRSLLANWAPVTIELTLMAVVLTVLIGIPLAFTAGLARSRLSKGLARLSGALAMSIPDFVIGSIFLYLFSRYSLGLTVGGYVPFSADPAGNIRSMVLPAVTLSVFGIAIVVRTGRDAVASVMTAPHVLAAVARGESVRHILRHHVIRNSAIPIMTVLAVYTGYLMGGAVIVEKLFSLPGVGQATIEAVQGRDYPVVQAVVLIAAAVFITINMVADVLYGIIDPRITAGARR